MEGLLQFFPPGKPRNRLACIANTTCPYLTLCSLPLRGNKTLNERDSLKLEATKKKDPVLHHEFKLKRNEVKNAIPSAWLVHYSESY